MITVVKIGGNVIDSEELTESFCKDFAALEGPRVLIHGGGVMATRLHKALGGEPKFINGRRITDAEALKAAVMVYAGWCNKSLVAMLQKMGCNAMGLSGCDAGAITARRRPPLGGVDYGLVGDVTPESVNKQLITSLLNAGITPVFSAINHDGQGQLLNTNADTMASSIASALEAELVICFEKPGVLGPDGVIPSISESGFTALKEAGTVSGGMVPKIENAIKALKSGATSVRITSSSDLLSGGGTIISL